MTYRFDGPADDIYATLVVRLHHTMAFDSTELWKSAADFSQSVEQENWVRRYQSSLNESDWLIYLTLHGDAPLQIDDDAKDKVICISYATTIVQWLIACRKEVSTVPIVLKPIKKHCHCEERRRSDVAIHACARQIERNRHSNAWIASSVVPPSSQ